MVERGIHILYQIMNGVIVNNMYHQLSKEQRKKLKNMKLTVSDIQECHDCNKCLDILEHIEVCRKNNG